MKMTAYDTEEWLEDSSGRTDLWHEAQAGHEAAARAILDSTARSEDLLDLVEPVHGWTALFIACINGHFPVA